MKVFIHITTWVVLLLHVLYPDKSLITYQVRMHEAIDSEITKFIVGFCYRRRYELKMGRKEPDKEENNDTETEDKPKIRSLEYIPEIDEKNCKLLSKLDDQRPFIVDDEEDDFMMDVITYISMLQVQIVDEEVTKLMTQFLRTRFGRKNNDTRPVN